MVSRNRSIYLQDDRLEELRGHIRDGAHQQTTRRRTPRHAPQEITSAIVEISKEKVLPLRDDVADVDEVLGARDKVEEGVFLLEHLAVLVPWATIVALTANVKICNEEIAIHQRDENGLEHGVLRTGVTAVTVEVGGQLLVRSPLHNKYNIRILTKDVDEMMKYILFMGNGDGNGDTIMAFSVEALRHIVLRVEPAEHLRALELLKLARDWIESKESPWGLSKQVIYMYKFLDNEQNRTVEVPQEIDTRNESSPCHTPR